MPIILDSNGNIITHANIVGSAFDTYNAFGVANDKFFCGDGVEDMSNAFNSYRYRFLNSDAVCGNNVKNMASAYYDFQGYGSPACGESVTNMYQAYYNCTNLIGDPVCGDSVINMASAYSDCSNLTGHPVCGNNVKNMSGAYRDCINLTGSPAISNSVNVFANIYRNCTNLTGTFRITPNTVLGSGYLLAYAFTNCTNLESGYIELESAGNGNYAYFIDGTSVSNLVMKVNKGISVNTRAFNTISNLNIYVNNQNVYGYMVNNTSYNVYGTTAKLVYDKEFVPGVQTEVLGNIYTLVNRAYGSKGDRIVNVYLFNE